MTWKTTGVVIGFIAATALASACSSETREVYLGERPGASGGFAPEEAPPDAGAVDASTAQLLCATSECPAGTATCELSRARCDVDLLTDRNNCGACGRACPPDSVRQLGGAGPFLEVVFHCSHGDCAMACAEGYADCDGFPDNGCETWIEMPDNCGACGVKCADGEPCTDGVCGCPAPQIPCDGYCVDPMTNSGHCGVCDNSCDDPDPPPWEHRQQMQCVKGACTRQCDFLQGDCDGDPTNGCEQRLNESEHCGACGNACPSGTECVEVDETWQCGCPTGYRACPFYDGLRCIDILSDPRNCGGCGVTCQAGEDAATPLVTETAACRGGVCELLCKVGRADCNGFSGDGCEVDLQTDPLHCGACGHECDLALGQPCVNGECAVAACTGEETR